VNKLLFYIIIIIALFSACSAEQGRHYRNRPRQRSVTVKAVPLPQRYIEVIIGKTKMQDVFALLGEPKYGNLISNSPNKEWHGYIPNEEVINVTVHKRSNNQNIYTASPGRRNAIIFEYRNSILTNAYSELLPDYMLR
jgi:hypothetical protein